MQRTQKEARQVTWLHFQVTRYLQYYSPFPGFHESLKMLLENGADPRVTDNDDATSLHSAASNGHLESLKILFEAKSGNHGNFAIHLPP
jgi:ankyrin repeat protein